MKRMISVAAAATVLLAVGTSQSTAAIFGLNSLAVFQAGEGGTTSLTSNTSINILELNKSFQTSPVQTISIPTLWASGTATSTGYMSLSENRQSVQFNGITDRGTGPAFPNANTRLARGVGSVDGNGNFSIIANYSGTSGQQTRAAALFTNGNINIADQAGLYAPAGSAAALAGNFRNTRIFGGVAYVAQASSTVTTIAINAIGGTPSAPTITGLPGLTNLSALQDFYMLDTDTTAGPDLLYINTATSATAGSILKFQLVAGSWVARGTAATTGTFGLAAELNASGGVSLFATSGLGATTANNVLLFTDASGPGATINLSTATTLYTAPANTTLKGIEIIPAPGTVALLGIGGLVAARRRRN